MNLDIDTKEYDETLKAAVGIFVGRSLEEVLILASVLVVGASQMSDTEPTQNLDKVVLCVHDLTERRIYGPPVH